MSELNKENLDELKKQQELYSLVKDLKRRLKVYSKSQLIAIIIDQANRYHQMQEINKQLLETKNDTKEK